MTREQIKGKYRPVYRCGSCEGRMTWGAMMGSDGVCPHCGSVSDSTIVSCKTSSEFVPSFWTDKRIKYAKYIIYGAILAPFLFAGLYGCMAMVEPGNQAVIEWKSE